MPRGRPKSQPSIADLQAMIREQKAERGKLVKERKKLQGQLDRLDRQLQAFDEGKGAGGVGSRPRNDKSLPEAIAEGLKKNGKAMKIGEIAEAVEESGYQSSSANFRGIVNQTLIKEPRFKQESRGKYKLGR
jgi:hypothetical protein